MALAEVLARWFNSNTNSFLPYLQNILLSKNVLEMHWLYAGDQFCVTEHLLLQPAWKAPTFNSQVGQMRVRSSTWGSEHS